MTPPSLKRDRSETDMPDLTHLEAQLEHDMQVLRDRLSAMSRLALSQLEEAVNAFTRDDRSLAYTVVLRDHRIDVMEQRLDRLAEEFLVRHMPVSAQLRFVIALLKVNSELERIGDYAEGIARRAVRLKGVEIPGRERVLEMSRLAFRMLEQSVEAFLKGDTDEAFRTLASDRVVDRMNTEFFELLSHSHEGPQDLGARMAVLGLVNRIERVADRACNIAEDAVYVARGQVVRHFPRNDVRVLFLCEHNNCLSQMAEGIGRKLAPIHFYFASAGAAPTAVDPRTVRFLAAQGLDISRQRAKAMSDVGSLEDFSIVVILSHQRQEEICPSVPYQSVRLDWDLADPSQMEGPEEQLQQEYQRVFTLLHEKIEDLTKGVVGAFEREEDE
jgi:phosphate transport system protein